MLQQKPLFFITRLPIGFFLSDPTPEDLEPLPLFVPPTILSTDLSLDPPQSMQGSHSIVSTAEKHLAGIATGLTKIW